MNRTVFPKRRRGFSLLEIIIVIGLIATIAGIIMAGLGGADEGAKRKLANIFVSQTVRTSLRTFQLNMGRYPSTEEGLQALVEAPTGAGAKWGTEPYLEPDQIKDPWGNQYKYRYPPSGNSTKPDVWSVGPDGKDGTEDDIKNWE